MGECASIRGSAAPIRHTTLLMLAPTVKRERVEDYSENAKRKKIPRLGQPSASGWKVKCEDSESSSHDHIEFDFATGVIPSPAANRADNHAHPRELGNSSSGNSVDRLTDTSGVGNMVQATCENETSHQKRDRFMHSLRVATGPEDLDYALDTIQPQHSRVRHGFRSAQTEDAKLKILRAHRIYVFGQCIGHMQKHKYVTR